MTIHSRSIGAARARAFANSLTALTLLLAGSALEARNEGEASRFDDSQVSRASVGEFAFRKNATHMVMPLYPPDALAKKITGVAVAFVMVSKEGQVALVDVIEAPNKSIKEAVEAAMKQWTFGVVTAGRKGGGNALEIESKVTFYFSISKAGQGEVRSPELGAKGAIAPTPDAPIPAPQITESQLAVLQKSRRAVLVDIRDRSDFAQGHTSGALNIPADEVEARVAELPAGRPIVIECQEGSIDLCRFVSRIVTARGFKEVSLLTKK